MQTKTKRTRKKSTDTNYWNVDRINARIDSYVLGVQARIDRKTMGVNPFNHMTDQERWSEWRKGWMEGDQYQTGRTKLFFLMEEAYAE